MKYKVGDEVIPNGWKRTGQIVEILEHTVAVYATSTYDGQTTSSIQWVLKIQIPEWPHDEL